MLENNTNTMFFLLWTHPKTYPVSGPLSPALCPSCWAEALNAQIRNDPPDLWSKARLGPLSVFIKHGPRRPVWWRRGEDFRLLAVSPPGREHRAETRGVTAVGGWGVSVPLEGDSVGSAAWKCSASLGGVIPAYTRLGCERTAGPPFFSSPALRRFFVPKVDPPTVLTNSAFPLTANHGSSCTQAEEMMASQQGVL